LTDRDQQLFDSFMLVLGILIGAVIGLLVLARLIAVETPGSYAEQNPRVQAAIEQRIRPVGQVVLRGEATAAPEAAARPQPAPVATTLSGPQVYNAACFLCHAPPGVGGAPPLGNADAWAPRIAQGVDVLHQHALNGYQGKTGVMPPKGGRVDLSDEEVMSAVDFMVQQAEK
jgi:cytochrome c5